MATIKERPDSYRVRGIIKRDFQHDHSGPEEMPYRKKGTGKKYCKANKGEHLFDLWDEWRTYSTWRYRCRVCKCGKNGHYGSGYQSQHLVERTYINFDGVEVTEKRWL